jgi:hypothetical protein
MAMMTQRLAGKITRCTVAVCAFLVFIIANLSLVRAQSATEDWEKAAGGKMSFEVASLKPNDSGPNVWSSSNSVFGLGDKQLANGVLRATNVPLITYIAFAYKLDPTGTRGVAMQLPEWTRHPFYDIEAELPGNNFTNDQVRLMMQSLLADRFKLAVHFDTKDGPAYPLVLAKAGKLGSEMRAYPDGFPCTEVFPSGRARSRIAAPIVPTIDDGRLPASCGQIRPLPPTAPGIMREAGRSLSMDRSLRGSA